MHEIWVCSTGEIILAGTNRSTLWHEIKRRPLWWEATE